MADRKLEKVDNTIESKLSSLDISAEAIQTHSTVTDHTSQEHQGTENISTHAQDITIQPDNQEFQFDDDSDDDNDGFRIPTVPPDFTFNKLLMDIENSITRTELEKLKAMLRGDEMLGERVLCETETASELFKVMRQRLMISRENILWLQAILRVLERPELILKTIEWARMYGNILHFREAPESINGFSNVKFHVEGIDFTNLSVRKLHKLRTSVAHLVGVDERYIIIAGVEPSSSFVVTLMMPDMYVNILRLILKKTNEIEELNEMGVDTIAIGEEMFNVNGVVGGEVVATDQQMKFLNVYKRLKTKSKLLEEREIECLKLSREPNLTLQTFKNIFPNVPVADEDSGTLKRSPAALSSQSAFVEFQEALKQVTICGYDRRVIQRLLNSNSSIVNLRVRDNHRIKMQQMDLAIQDLQSMTIPMQSELQKYKFYLQFDVQDWEKNILTKLQNLLQHLAPTVEVTLNEAGLILMKKVSKWVRPNDRKKLQKKYNWNPNDQLTQALHQDPSLLFVCLFHKEIERTKRNVDIVKFVNDCLKEVGREDVIKKFNDAVKHQQQVPPTRRDESPFHSKTQQPSKEVPQPQNPSPSVPNIDMANLIDQVSEMSKKVTEIHKTIQSSQRAYNTEYGTKYNFGSSDQMYTPYPPRETFPSF